jgi:hypothetical protein
MASSRKIYFLGSLDIKELYHQISEDNWFKQNYNELAKFFFNNFKDFKEFISNRKVSQTLKELGKNDLVILSFHYTWQFEIKKSDILETTDNGRLIKHLITYRPRKRHLIFEELWNIRKLTSKIRAKIFILDSHYKFPYCCPEPSHSHEKFIGRQLYFNKAIKQILGGTEEKGPHVLDHRNFLTEIISKKSIKNRKKYGSLLLDNETLASEVRQIVGTRVTKLIKDKCVQHLARKSNIERV